MLRLRAVSAAISASFVTAALLTGCGLSPAADSGSMQPLELHGVAHGGQPPVSGAHVALFATATSGYNGTVTPLATATADVNGNFTLQSAYTCPSGQQAYIVAAGGNPGAATGTDNSALFLVAALGPCSSINAGTFITVNEVTTVAAAYALSGFVPAGGAGMTEAAVLAGAAMPGVTSSSSNVRGLTDAFANAANIVDYTHGAAYATTPGNSSGVVPQAAINTLADILQSCVNTTGPGTTGCSTLFAAAAPPSGTGIAAPVNVFQAAVDIAQFPGSNTATLFSQISSSAAFQPTLSAAPNDWTLGIVYTNALLTSGSGLGIDANDEVYVTGAGYLLDFSAQGAPLTSTNLLANDPAITTIDTLREIAFDKSGNLFITDGAYTGVYEYTPGAGTLTARNFSTAPAEDTNANTYGVAVDALGDVFTASYSKSNCATPATNCTLVEFPASASGSYPAYTPFSSFSGYTVTQPTGASTALGGARGIAFDVKTGNIWLTSIDDNVGELFTVSPSSDGPATAAGGPVEISGLGPEVSNPGSNTAYGTISVAVDSSSRAWFVVEGGPVSTSSKTPTSAVPGALYPVSSTGTVGTGVTGGGLNLPDTAVVDGNNRLFVANQGTGASTSSVIEYSPALGVFLSPNIGFAPGATYSSTSGSLSGGVLYEPQYLAVDRSGALWTLSSGNGTTHAANLVQILGVAAPVDPVQADGSYGVKP